MMNVLALCLLFTTVVTAGVFSPNPKKPNSKEDVIVKEGHRVVVVEFEKDDGNTKVSISPQDSQSSHHVDEKGYITNMKEKLSEKMEDAKEKIKEASSSVLPEMEKEGNSLDQEEEIHRGFSPRELVCDAYGKCKHKIASVIGKTKEAVSEKAHEAADKVYVVEEEAKEAVSETIGKVKDTVTHTAHQASDKVREAKESMKDAASEVSNKAKDKVAEKASEMKEGVNDQAEKAKRQVYDVIDTTKKKKEEVEKDAMEKMKWTKEKVSGKAKEAEEMVENASNRVKQGAHRVKKEGKKELKDIFRRAREVAIDVLAYMVPPVSMASVTGVLHLLGFAAAYGMCVWVTFVSSYVLATSLPRHQFAMVQSKIYPVYFKAMAYSVGMALLGHLLSQRKRLSPISVGMFQGFNLLMPLVMVLVNLLYLEPRATKVMFERMKKEKEEGRGKESVHDTEPSGRVVDSMTEIETAGRGVSTGGTSTTQGSSQEKPADTATNSQIIRMSEILRRLNSYSSFLNVLTLMSLTCHLVHLGQRLHTHTVC